MNINDFREVMKATLFDELGESIISDQEKKLPQPPLEKGYSENEKLIDLVSPDNFTSGNTSLIEILNNRKSRRAFSKEPLTLEEFSFLVWSSQGVKRATKNATFRTAPSAGARHPFETYLAVFNIEGLESGLYRYLALEHKLAKLHAPSNLKEDLLEACYGQKFAIESAVTFIWTVVPYRTEWRYNVASARVILMDVGHVCENLYLASESINAGTCAIGAYKQDKIDELIRVDGNDEFAIYLAPIGKY